MRIRRLLIANRGEIARRIARTARQMGIEAVAVYSEADAESPHVRDADLTVAIGGYAASESYLDAAKLVAAARRTGADAVHPGYGFLSENPDFAQACLDAGLIWVGPSPEAMRVMADKVQARQLAADLGVPVLPGGPVGVGDSGWLSLAREVGFPLLVKAAGGGGGRGVRHVSSERELAEAIHAAQREAAAAFGDPTVFLEREVQQPKHIEVQVFGDQHGNLVHLFERECSIQRRHQKLIEEAPAACLPPATRDDLCSAALTLARAIGYTNAGTVEFLVESDSRFWFLEMNTRLQVEHAVTEAITGFDLVRLQIQVAMGEVLGVGQEQVEPRGHAIEARLYAEDPAHEFMPSSGRIHRFSGPADDTVRWDAGVESGSEVSSFYDGLLAKAIAHAPTRVEAAMRLGRHLRAVQVHGPATNRDCLVAILESEAFRSGQVSTQWLAEHTDVLSAGPPREVRQLHALAAALVLRDRRRARASVLPFAPGGWRNVRSADQRRGFTLGDEVIEVTYAVADRGGAVQATVMGTELHGRIHGVKDDTVDLEVDGVRARYAIHSVGLDHYVNDGRWQTLAREQPRFAHPEVAATGQGPAAPLPGTVVAVHVQPGQRVRAGEVLVVLDAMKIEHQVVADFDARVAEVRVAPGERVDAHQVLVVLEG